MQCTIYAVPKKACCNVHICSKTQLASEVIMNPRNGAGTLAAVLGLAWKVLAKV